MTEPTYIIPVSTHQDCHGLKSPIPECPRLPAPLVISTYPEVPYTAAVSPFGYPASCEPHLLTPISSTSSPPMPHTAKLGHHYNGSPTGPGSQQPTPPATSQMFWQPTFDMSANTSQCGSPITAGHPQGEDHFAMAYTHQDDIPEPPAPPYYGHFGVSASVVSDQDEPMEAMTSFYPIPSVQPHPLMGTPHQQQPEGQHQHHEHPPLAAHVPMTQPALPLSSPQTANPPPEPQCPGADQVPSPYTSSPAYITSAASPKSSRAKPRRAKKPSEPKPRVSTNRIEKTTRVARGPTSPFEAPRELSDQIQFRINIPDEERYLLELRMKHEDTKGTTMWDDIAVAFAARFGKKPEKPALQMKLTRAKQKWVIWPKKDVDLLRAIFYEDEKERYQRITTKFNERGGGANLGFNASNIECQLVDMGLEDITMDAATKIRPRRRAKDRGRTGAKISLDSQQMQSYPMDKVELTDAQRENLYREAESRVTMDEAGAEMDCEGEGDNNALQTQTIPQHPANELVGGQYYPHHHSGRGSI